MHYTCNIYMPSDEDLKRVLLTSSTTPDTSSAVTYPTWLAIWTAAAASSTTPSNPGIQLTPAARAMILLSILSPIA